MSLVTEVGFWSEIKLEIIREYAAAYSRVLTAQQSPTLYHLYIDAFAGAGVHVSRETGAWVPGTPSSPWIPIPLGNQAPVLGLWLRSG